MRLISRRIIKNDLDGICELYSNLPEIIYLLCNSTCLIKVILNENWNLYTLYCTQQFCANSSQLTVMDMLKKLPAIGYPKTLYQKIRLKSTETINNGNYICYYFYLKISRIYYNDLFIFGYYILKYVSFRRNLI